MTEAAVGKWFVWNVSYHWLKRGVERASKLTPRRAYHMTTSTYRPEKYVALDEIEDWYETEDEARAVAGARDKMDVEKREFGKRLNSAITSAAKDHVNTIIAEQTATHQASLDELGRQVSEDSGVPFDGLQRELWEPRFKII